MFCLLNFQNPNFKTLLKLDYDLISLDLNLLSRIQFSVGSTSHLHTTILYMTRALASTINLYIKPMGINQLFDL
jgi:hypothetical protein